MKNTDKLNRHIFIRDNLEVLRTFDSESIDLIYLDPPFNSNKDYNAPIGSESAGSHFKDRWTLDDTDRAWWGELADKHPALYSAIHAVGVISGDRDKSYLIYMAIRLLEMKRVLKDTGSIYFHCDQIMGYGLKLVMDAVFGKENFKNEIIWKYFKPNSGKKNYPKSHDTIFFYTKKTGVHYFDYKACLEPYNEKAKKRYNKIDKDGKRYKIYNNKDGKKRIAYMKSGKPVDVFTIPFVQGISKEKVGYPTQKPIKLMERIIKASSKEGDLVLDPFCGCATTCIASEKLNRRWIGIDLSSKAGELVKIRLQKELGFKSSFLKSIHIRETLPIRNAPKPSKDIKWTLFGKQEGKCNGCGDHFYFRHLHKDHIIPKARGGQDTDKNLQLLCAYCNSKKGVRPMSYLIAERENLKKVA